MYYFINGFKHLPGKNCVTTALRNILNFYHKLMSEELIFGLSGGLGFYYKELDGFPNPFIGGSASGLVQKFCDYMGLKLYELRKEDPEAAHKSMIGKIMSDLPVIIQIDLYYLDYFSSKFHFPLHRLIPVGIDDEYIHVADTGYRSIKKTDIERFKQGRVSDYPPGSPGNLQLFIEKPQDELPIIENLWEVIADNAGRMIYSIDANGLEAMERFTSNPDKFNDLEYLYIQIERAGTGGALGRLMYRDFLSEANLYRPHPNLVEAYELYSEVVDIYRRVVNGIKKGQRESFDKNIGKTFLLEKKAVETLLSLPVE
jgi:hypothetical protein